ncbi:hypothetical protein RclHR1_06240002 [Rhizophagus clarus]|uniref:Cytochrome P450 n=1 Tax=Rhizophagus clarus TaxID=94130 RepID=A0A2Z6RRD8_9GLOM|nr:hypothetical protein RclHR1_06240002 [Rhizophagus clarus]
MIFSKLFENIDYLSLIGIALIIYVTNYYYKYFTRINPLPGPFPYPFFALNRIEQSEKLLLSSSRNPFIKKHSTKDGKGFHELGILGKGLLFNQELKSWKYNRHFFTQAILSPKFANEAVHLINIIFNELEGYWDKLYLKEGNNKNKMDISTWFNQFTNDMIFVILTGERSYTMAGYFNEISENEKAERPSALIDETVKFVRAIRNLFKGILMFQFVSPFLRHYFPYFKNKSDEVIQSLDFINQRMDSIIKRRRQEIENTPLDKPLSNDLLTTIIIADTPRDLSYNKNDDKEVMRPMTDLEIRGIIFDGIIAGTDTVNIFFSISLLKFFVLNIIFNGFIYYLKQTANTISYIIYYLANNPDVKKKMLNEIDRIFQGDKTRPITESDINNLKYCEAIVKEVSRIFSVVNSLPRCLEKSDEIGGYQWPPETIFRINIDAIHHNKEYWDEPDKFNPDRWLAEDFEPKKNSFIAFGRGLRICAGRKLAMVELVGLIALLFRKYEIDLVNKEAPLKTYSEAVTACTELLVEIKLRN